LEKAEDLRPLATAAPARQARVHLTVFPAAAPLPLPLPIDSTVNPDLGATLLFALVPTAATVCLPALLEGTLLSTAASKEVDLPEEAGAGAGAGPAPGPGALGEPVAGNILCCMLEPPALAPETRAGTAAELTAAPPPAGVTALEAATREEAPPLPKPKPTSPAVFLGLGISAASRSLRKSSTEPDSFFRAAGTGTEAGAGAAEACPLLDAGAVFGSAHAACRPEGNSGAPLPALGA
jgi:hypothetical protein